MLFHSAAAVPQDTQRGGENFILADFATGNVTGVSKRSKLKVLSDFRAIMLKKYFYITLARVLYNYTFNFERKIVMYAKN